MTPLESLAQMAAVLDGADFLDGTSRNQRRELRKAADGVGKAIEDTVGLVTPEILVAFFAGAATEATMSADMNPLSRLMKQVMGAGADKQLTPNNVLTILVAYLARDLLAGERVE